jgi:hypothetical protein
MGWRQLCKDILRGKTPKSIIALGFEAGATKAGQQFADAKAARHRSANQRKSLLNARRGGSGNGVVSPL